MQTNVSFIEATVAGCQFLTPDSVIQVLFLVNSGTEFEHDLNVDSK